MTARVGWSRHPAARSCSTRRPKLAPRAQAKPLPVLQDSELRRLGENRTQRLDLRIVAAASRPLDGEAAEGRLREDPLYAGAAHRARFGRR